MTKHPQTIRPENADEFFEWMCLTILWCWHLKVLQSDKLSGDGQIFQVWPYFSLVVMIKLPFSQQENLQIFPTSLVK